MESHAYVKCKVLLLLAKMVSTKISTCLGGHLFWRYGTLSRFIYEAVLCPPPLFRGSSREKEILKSDLRNIGFFVCGTVYGFVRCRPELIGNMLLGTHVM